MEFLTSGEKIKRLRVQLSLTQDDLQSENVTRGLISMIETGKRDLTYAAAIKLSDKFNKKAEELGFILNVDAQYLIRSPKQDAELYCLTQLKDNSIMKNTIDDITKIADDFGLIEIKAKINFKIGEINENNKEFDEACANYEEAVKLYKDIRKEDKLALIYLRLGSCKQKSLKYDTSIVYYNQSQYYAFTFNNKEVQGRALYNLANAYKKTNKIALALETIEKYLEVSDETAPFYYFGFNTKAICYELAGNYNEAIATYKNLLNIISNTDKPILGYVYNNLGLNYCHKYNFKESLKYFEKAESFKSTYDRKNLSHTLIEKSYVFLKQNLYDEAIKTIDNGLNLAIEYNDIEYLIKGYQLLEEIYDKLNDLDKLEDTYKKLAELLKINKDIVGLKAVYNNMALLYSKQSNADLCQKYLLLSKDLF